MASAQTLNSALHPDTPLTNNAADLSHFQSPDAADASVLQKVATGLVGRMPTVLVRKKLPWLDVGRNGTRTNVTQITTSGLKDGVKPDIQLGERVETPPENEKVEAANRITSPRLLNYASSEYSTTVSDVESLPPGLPKKDPASYERLVTVPVRRPEPPRPSRFVENWLKDGTSAKDIQTTSGELSPRSHDRGTKLLKPPPGLHRKDTVQINGRLGHQRCESCEAGLSPREMPDARGQRTQKRIEDESPVVPPPTTRRPTLQELPLHLQAQSSSSSRSSTSRELNNLRRAVIESHGSRMLGKAMTGLESLMEDAVDTAGTAVDSGRHDEVARVLDEASRALGQATSVGNAMEQPRPLSAPESLPSSDSTRDDESPNTVSRSRKGPSLHILRASQTKSSTSQRRSVPNFAKDQVLPKRSKRQHTFPSENPSMTRAPSRLYPVNSIVRDFAYSGPNTRRLSARSVGSTGDYGAAADYYGDHGQSVVTQPGIRQSIWGWDKQLPPLPDPVYRRQSYVTGKGERVQRAHLLHRQTIRDRALSADDAVDPKELTQRGPLKSSPTPQQSATVPAALQDKLDQDDRKPSSGSDKRKRASYVSHHWHTPAFMQSAYYRETDSKKHDSGTDASVAPPLLSSHNWSLKHPRRGHLSIAEGQGFSLGRYRKRQPIAREWNMRRKRLTATIACLNTIFTGLIAGIYAGEVPRIQIQLGDTSHWVIFGNMLFFIGMGLTTLIFWPLPLLHGRRPYILIAFGLMLPFHIPQALAVSIGNGPSALYSIGLLLSRALTGLALGFANINLLPTLLDLYGASLMSEKPHQEVVAYDDIRRQGGGIGVWLGIWTFCFTSSLSIGFCIGACIISMLNASWGFWIIIMLLAFFLLVNVISPETRKSAYRRSVHHFYDSGDPEKVRRRVARGEVKLHISNDGPRFWWEEVWAGLILTKRMVLQPGYFVLMVYLAWIYAQLTLVILLLGALLSRNYRWASCYVGLAALAIPIGAALAMPLTKASWLSRARITPPRTDSMTMRQPRFTWTSHFVRRIIFSVLLPFAGAAYCMTSPGPPLHWAACVIFAGFMGFLTDLAIAECIGLIMETFDTCDLQPGVNTKHRQQSMSEATRRRRTNYSSFPRVCAAFFAAQSLGFFLAAAATVVSGRLTNTYGAQMSMYIFAAILLGVTLLFFVIITRWKEVQVVPDKGYSGGEDWKAVVIGNPSGKMRRVNLLEMGKWTRWSEIRRLNGLV